MKKKYYISYKIFLFIYRVGKAGGFLPKQCRIMEKGNIRCFPHIKCTTRCEADFTYWPFDVQNCTLIFSSWSYSHREIQFTMESTDLLTGEESNGNRWNILSMNGTLRKEHFKFNKNYETTVIEVSAVVKRHSNILRTAFVVPAFGNSALNNVKMPLITCIYTFNFNNIFQ